jgi:hypothetical protein
MTRFLAPLCAALCAAAVPAQMSGSYIINPAGGTGVFVSFTAAVSALFVNGVNAPVTMLVAPASYNESVLIPPIPGTSATNTVTFRALIGPGTVMLHGNGGDNIAMLAVRFAHNPGIVFDGLDFVDAPGNAIYGTTFVEGVEIMNCNFGPQHLGPSGYPRGALINATFDQNEAGWKIHHNHMTCPAGSSAFGIYLQNGGGWDIHHNSIDLNGTQHGIYLINNNTRLDTIWDNLIFGALQNQSGNYASNATAISVDVSNFNNDIVNNTFLVTIPGAGAIIASVGFGTNLNRMYGNVFALTGGGTCISQDSYNSPPQYIFRSDGNLFYVPNGGEVGRLGASNTGFNTLSAWQAASGQDAGSVQADPQFVQGIVAPYDLHVLSTSPTRNAAINTPAYVTTDYDGRARDAQPDIGAYEGSGFGVFGQGCAGTNSQVPVIGATGTAAIGGSNFAITLANARANSLSLLIGGFSRTQAGPIQLPYSLGGGCSVLVSPDAVRNMVSDPQGAATAPTPIPNDPGLQGHNIYFQWAVVDPNSVSPIGVTVSNGGVLQL